MKPVFALMALGLLAACENGFEIPDFRGGGAAADVASAPTLQFSDRERLITAISNNGCAISPANVGPILSQASLSSDQLRTLMIDLEAEGTLVEDGADTLRLAPAQCISTTGADALPI